MNAEDVYDNGNEKENGTSGQSNEIMNAVLVRAGNFESALGSLNLTETLSEFVLSLHRHYSLCKYCLNAEQNILNSTLFCIDDLFGDGLPL